LVLLPDFMAQLQSELGESREVHIRVKSMNAEEQTINCWIGALEARQRDISAHHPVIESGLLEVRESANRAERKLSELVTEIGSVYSAAAAWGTFSRRADDAYEWLTQSERGGARLAAEVKAFRRHSNGAHKQTAAHKSDISQIKKDLKQLRGRVGQLPRSPIPARLVSLMVSEFRPLFGEFRAKRWALLWWGSYTDFGAAEFHRRCDRRANNLAVIRDTDGNMFGLFTPVE
jgi:hypothetical protein